jgi:hypothetical protein
VTCSECGAQTHPLAEQITAAGPAAIPAATSTAHAVKLCDNCGGAIGRLQATHDWLGHIVCGGCFQRLSSESGGAALAAPAPRGVTPAVVIRARPADSDETSAVRPAAVEIRERVLRALVVFVVASVALYGALALLRDIAGLVAVAAVAVIALLCLYALFRGTLAARRRMARGTDLAPARPNG